jgi:hypothetical protein
MYEKEECALMSTSDSNSPPSVNELTRIRDIELNDAEYPNWKCRKIEDALQQADAHPDNVSTDLEI